MHLQPLREYVGRASGATVVHTEGCERRLRQGEGAPQQGAGAPAAGESERASDPLVREYTRYGISLAGLLHFSQMVAALIADEHTTSDVCQTIVKPRTLPRGWRTQPELTDATNRYYTHTYFPVPDAGGAEGAPQPTAPPGTKPMCQVLEEDPATRCFVGAPTHFLSHAWGFLFLNLLSGLRSFVAQLPADAPEPFFWIDCFVLDQHANNDQGAEWWRTTFMRAIGDIGHTVMMLSPWSNPVPLTRSWCLWELYCSQQTQARFSVCLGEAERDAFHEAIVQDSGVVLEAFATIDVRSAEAGDPVDRERILRAVDETVGSVELNSIAKRQLREWILCEARALVRSASASGRVQIGGLLRELGFLAEARQVVEDAAAESVEGQGDGQGGACVSQANVYQQQGDYPKALEYYQKALDIYIPSVGEQHVEVARVFQNMAGTFEKQDNRSDARQFYQKAMEIYRHSHGEKYTAWFEAQIERLGD